MSGDDDEEEKRVELFTKIKCSKEFFSHSTINFQVGLKLKAINVLSFALNYAEWKKGAFECNEIFLKYFVEFYFLNESCNDPYIQAFNF